MASRLGTHQPSQRSCPFEKNGVSQICSPSGGSVRVTPQISKLETATKPLVSDASETLDAGGIRDLQECARSTGGR
jgi:hypothetical protein